MFRPVALGRFLAIVVLSSLVAGLVLLDATQAQTDKGKKYALVVGVREYDHAKLRDLKYTENDAEELGKLLTRAGYDEVVLLTSTRGGRAAEARPTAANIRKQLKALLDKVNKRDVVLIALAGHGVQYTVTVGGKDHDESFFCPCDAKLRDSKDLKELSRTMLPLRELFKELDDSGAGARLLLVDACRNDPKDGRNLDVDTLPRPARGTAALFSCKSGERAFETDKLGKGHGVFFFHVLQGLQKATDEQGDVTWDQLIAYVRGRVSRQVPTLIGGGARQTPHLLANVEGDPVLLRPEKRAAGKEVIKSTEEARRLDREYEKTAIPFEPEKFTRKGKSDRAVLVEIFTGAQCPPCVAAQIAFDALGKTFSPRDVVLLQYHLHIPRPDPMTNLDTEARLKIYADAIEGTPTMFINGAVTEGMGGPKIHAKDSYDKLRKLVEKDLDTEAEAKVALRVSRSGDKIDVSASVSDLKKPGAKTKLHFVLVEETVRYVGTNGLRLHHHVVRALPGGADGVKLETKESSHKATVSVSELRKKLNAYLTAHAKKERFATPERPLNLEHLKVVALVQDDGSKKVLQAAQADVPEVGEE
jgi:hypothetical protein